MDSEGRVTKFVAGRSPKRQRLYAPTYILPDEEWELVVVEMFRTLLESHS